MSKKIFIGIDEAGKGCIIGDLIIGFCQISFNKEDEFKNIEKELEKLKVNDSKKLTQKKREEILDEISKNSFLKDKINFFKEKITPKEIDKNNLIEIEISKICEKLNQINLKNKISKIFIDCLLANEEKFQKIIEKKINFNCEIISKNKADSLFKIVSLSSIYAKNLREEKLKKLKEKYNIDFGSGYTSDKKTQNFLKDNFQNENYHIFIRKKWSTFQKLNQKSLKDF